MIFDVVASAVEPFVTPVGMPRAPRKVKESLLDYTRQPAARQRALALAAALDGGSREFRTGSEPSFVPAGVNGEHHS
jgi:hypothetical protein